jgi:putative Mg2+ transporter-C (MgtC) family protein
MTIDGIIGYLREFNVVSVMFRLILAVVSGGLIGVERERKGHPAGLRTHMLVCLGSALAILTNTFVMLQHGSGDPTRIAAQVISGIGFLGAGTILVTGQYRRQVKGLTTAAGLWASACIGLAVGAGFFEGAIIALILILIIMGIIKWLHDRKYKEIRALNLYAECVELRDVSRMIKELRRLGCATLSLEFGRLEMNNGISAFISISYPAQTYEAAVLLNMMQDMGGVLLIEQV